MDPTTAPVFRPVFRPDTCDANVWRSVFELNEYGLPDRFEPGEMVIDVGAHIGSFTAACAVRGATVIAFEPDSHNFEAASRNLGLTHSPEARSFAGTNVPVAVPKQGPPRMHLNFGAVVGSPPRWLHHTGPAYDADAAEMNTGGGQVVEPEGGRVKNVYGVSLKTVAWTIRDSGYPIRLLKLDCEGGEWDILHNTPLPVFASIPEIVGEWHGWAPDGTRHTVEELESLLRDHGYDLVVVMTTRPGLGLFRAGRKLMRPKERF